MSFVWLMDAATAAGSIWFGGTWRMDERFAVLRVLREASQYKFLNLFGTHIVSIFPKAWQMNPFWMILWADRDKSKIVIPKWLLLRRGSFRYETKRSEYGARLQSKKQAAGGNQATTSNMYLCEQAGAWLDNAYIICLPLTFFYLIMKRAKACKRFKVSYHTSLC